MLIQAKANVEAKIEVYADEMKKLKQYVKENGGGKRPGDVEVVALALRQSGLPTPDQGR